VRRTHLGSSWRTAFVALSCLLATVVVTVPAAAATSSVSSATDGVGTVTDTFVDNTRSTPANGGVPEASTRTLVTKIWYPAAEGTVDAPREGATPKDGPYPLIVFAHGLGGSPEKSADLLARWAAAGYVVAAPAFPLTNSDTPGGTNAADTASQPGDISFVISSMLQLAKTQDSPLHGLIDPKQIGVAGHSNGGVTTLGLIANTCCRDKRVKAAIVLAGTPGPYPDGKYDYASAPPTLVVHGTKDPLMDYPTMITVYNKLEGPKGLLSIQGADHGEYLDPSSKYFATTLKATTDFFDAYVKGNTRAIARLSKDGAPRLAVMKFTAKPGAKATIPTIPQPKLVRHAQASPTTGLTNGQTVTVEWRGYTPGKVVNVIQCVEESSNSGAAGCDLNHGKVLIPDPTGSGSTTLPVVAGTVGTGVCDADHPPCQIVVNDAGLTDPAASVRIPIHFAPN
jgi:predicted dienelactone hydrolase